MSLTAFQRVRRMQQVEAMKPENIQKQEEEVKEEVKEEAPVVEQVIEPKKEVAEEVKEEQPVRGRGKRN